MTIELDRGLVYSSAAIHERRRRILEETRKMIAERGLSGFSMDEICKRSGVAKRTLYNAFQTKERMVAIAIHEYFERFISRLPYTGPQGTMKRNIERMVFVIERNRQIRNYISAIMSLYFAPNADPDIWTTMHSMAVKPNLQWIQALKTRRQLQPWIEVDTLADDIVRCEYAIVNDWCQGRIDDDGVTLHLVSSVLTVMAGATRGMARREIEQALQDYQQSGLPVSAQPAIRIEEASAQG